MGMTSSRRRPRIKLGQLWSRFARPHPALTMLGIIQCGLEIGALARSEDGTYVQVNGGVVRPLRASRVEAAIARARCEQRPPSPIPGSSPSPSSPVVVVYKTTRRARSGALSETNGS